MPKIVDHDARRNTLLDGAEAVFAREGYAAVSMRELAAALEVSTGTLYHYFPNKQALFADLVDRVVEREVADIEALDLSGLPPAMRAAAIEVWFAGMEDTMAAEHQVLLEAARQVDGEDDAREQFETRMFDATTRYIAGVERALGVGPDFAAMVVHAVGGVVAARLLDGRRTPFAPLIRAVEAHLSALSGVSGHGATPPTSTGGRP